MGLAEIIKQKNGAERKITAVVPAQEKVPPQPPLTTQLPEEEQELIPAPPEPAKPNLIKRIGIFVSILALLALFSYEGMFLIFYTINKAVSSPFQYAAGVNIFRLLPRSTFIPVPFLALSPIILIYCALKIFNGSKKSWLITLSSLIGTQVYNSVLIFWMIHNITQQLPPEELIVPSQSSFEIGGLINSIVNLIPFLALIGILIAKRKDFNFEDRPLSLAKKTFFALFIFLITVPNFSYMGYLYYRSLEKTPGLKEAQAITSFHIYIPTELPEEYLWDGIMVNIEQPLTQSAGVRIVLGHKLTKEYLQEPIFPPIILNESIGLNNLTEEILSLDIEEDAIIQKQPITTAKNGYGFWSQYSIARRLTFLTPDNVLIDIVTLSRLDPYSLDYLLIIANSLQ